MALGLHKLRLNRAVHTPEAKKASKSHQYLYENMPRDFAQGLRYIHKMSDKIKSNEMNASGGSQLRDTHLDTQFLRLCFTKMLAEA